MIPIEALRQVRRIIVHRDCADGTAAAMILHDALPEASITAVAYGAEREALEPLPGLLFCDMTPPPRYAQAFASAGAIVLDHHKGARELIALFGERGVYADAVKEPGVSGATLAYREVWRYLKHMGGETPVGSGVRRLARLAGVRDTWQRADPLWAEACAQAEVLMFYPLEYWLGLNNAQAATRIPVPRLNEREQLLGLDLLQRKLRRAREIAETGCLRLSQPVQHTPWGCVEPRGAIAIFNDAPKPDSRISDVAEAMRDVDPAVKLVCGFYYEPIRGGMQLTYSLRSSPGAKRTAKQIAVANGGGGHEPAAGFVIRVDMAFADRSPVDIFKAALAKAGWSTAPKSPAPPP
jgi:hypothetical protein